MKTLAKSLALFFTLTLTLALFSFSSFSPNEMLINQAPNRIEIIDFHTTHRCYTCEAIEANTIYTLNTYFQKELANGSITMDVLNIDQAENEAIAEKFQVYGTSLFLNVIVDGVETPIDLTEFAFMKGTDQKAFSKELSEKIKEELQKL